MFKLACVVLVEVKPRAHELELHSVSFARCIFVVIGGKTITTNT